MAKTSVPHQESVTERVLELLSSLIARRGHSFSWYRSRKDRVWLTLKGFEPAVYTTSVEYDDDGSNTPAINAMTVLLYRHWPKFTEKEPPLNSWMSAKAVASDLEDSLAWIRTMPSRINTRTGEVDD